ncbi:MAG TPA: RluA family pseudouridine synthase, partial [Candidatus Saccharibacteria bacterium]|nr:RluA family pseudouridine synthase [Candidatus Saccharibacteria bacterium]
KNESQIPLRADVLLAQNYPKYSRAALAKLFTMGEITKNGVILKAGQKIKPKERFYANISLLEKPADNLHLPVIYEDSNVVVIDKPSGVISHASSLYWDEPSVASFIRDKVADLGGQRAGIVHRLDRATSGIMICAKNAKAMSFLQRQFAGRKVEKEYIAVIENNLEPPQAVIELPVARNPRKPQTFKVINTGKQATTEYHVLCAASKYSLVLLRPKTGRTHQIRVHLSYLKNPIVGDDLYKGKSAPRLFLHAYSLGLVLPNGTSKVFYSPVPREFIEIFDNEIVTK